MSKIPRNRIEDERLDQIGLTIVKVAGTNDAEAEAAATAPFLYARVRARIGAEQTRRAETADGWLALFNIAWRAVPTMAFIAALAATLMLWFAGASYSPTPRFNDEAFFDAREPGVERVVLADNGTLSRDEVLAIVVNREEQGTRK